jgi:hypothetical protein
MFLCALAALAGEARAEAPSGQYSVKDGTVQDNRTGLTWQQQPDGVVRAWSDAAPYCAALTTSGSGWRLPTYKELLTLVDPTRTAPAIDVTAFPGTAATAFWTASSYDGTSTQARYVDFNDGSSNFAGVATKRTVRCVR